MGKVQGKLIFGTRITQILWINADFICENLSNLCHLCAPTAPEHNSSVLVQPPTRRFSVKPSTGKVPHTECQRTLLACTSFFFGFLHSAPLFFLIFAIKYWDKGTTKNITNNKNYCNKMLQISHKISLFLLYLAVFILNLMKKILRIIGKKVCF